MSRSFRFIHSFGIEFIILKTELLENQIIVRNVEDSERLFTQGYYGKPIGNPKPKLSKDKKNNIVSNIETPLLLDLIEGYYLMVNSKIKIYKDKKIVSEDKMLDICKEQHNKFEMKFRVYKDLRDKGYIVTPGIKFGSDFAVYQKGPGIDHAPYIILIYESQENLSPTDLVLIGRLAHGVQKKFIFAIPSGKDKINYLSMEWSMIGKNKKESKDGVSEENY